MSQLLLNDWEAIQPFEDAVMAAKTVPARLAAVMDLHGATLRFFTEHRYELDRLVRQNAEAAAGEPA